MGYKALLKPSRDELKRLCKTLTNKQVANYIGCDVTTISHWKKQYALSNLECKHPNLPNSFSNKQMNFLIGTNLGDGHLSKPKAGANARLRLKQCRKFKEYIDETFQIMSPFSSNIYEDKTRRPKRVNGKISNSLKDWDGTYLYSDVMETIHCPLITRMWEKWYINREKIVPLDLMLNWEIIAHWYVQDGNNHQLRTSITLHTNSFTRNEVLFLISRLKKDVDINAQEQIRKNSCIIYIPKSEYFKFIKGVKPYVTWKCFEYKVDTSKVLQTREGWGRWKLNKHLARRIRQLYDTDNYTQARLAEMFGVTQGMIGRIINNKAYVERYLGIQGGADVQVSYNV